MNLSIRGRGVGAAIAATSMLAALASCSEILGIDSHRSLPDPDTGTPVPEVGPPTPEAEAAAKEAGPWDCLSEPPQTFPANAMTTVHLITTNSLQPILTAEAVDGGSALYPVQYTPLVGEQVRACPSLYGGECASGTAYETSNEAGIANFTLLNSFGGYYEFNDPTLFTTAFFPSQMLAGDKEAYVSATLLPLAATQSLGALLNGITLDYDTDGGLGHILISIYDCFDHSAPGVVFTPSATASSNSGYTTLIFYTEGAGGSSSELPSTTATATDPSGTGGLLNVPTGIVTVKASLASNPNVHLGLLNMIVRPGVASSGILRVRTH